MPEHKKVTLDKHITLTAVKERGWTAAMINTMLGEPDATKVNPIYKCAAPMKLYLLDRVETTEKKDAFAEAMAKTEKRREGSKKAVATKTKNTLDLVDEMDVTVTRIPMYRVMSESLAAWEFHQSGIGKDSYGGSADEVTRHRWALNYIRHHLTHWDTFNGDIFGQVGKDEAYKKARRKIMDAIFAVYPELA